MRRRESYVKSRVLYVAQLIANRLGVMLRNSNGRHDIPTKTLGCRFTRCCGQLAGIGTRIWVQISDEDAENISTH